MKRTLFTLALVLLAYQAGAGGGFGIDGCQDLRMLTNNLCTFSSE